MTAAEMIKSFDFIDCPVAAVDGEMNILAANKTASTKFASIFAENCLKTLLLTEEIIEIKAKTRELKSVTLRPQSGAFVGAVLQIMPADTENADFFALVFMTDTGKNIVKNAPATEKQFMAKFFEPKMREMATSVFANVDLIRNSQATVLTASAEKSLENIVHEGYEVLRLADHMRLITALETEELNLTSCDMISFISDLMECVKIMMSGYEFDIRIKKETGGNKSTCSIDKDVLTRAILCLISNACKASGAGSIIKVVATATETDFRFSITNGGNYIPAQVIPHVFEPYFSYRTYDDQQRSTGLGLAIVKAAAERHGGTVLLQSSVQYGTTVMLRIPMRDGERMPVSLGQTARDYLTDRFSPVFIELYGI